MTDRSAKAYKSPWIKYGIGYGADFPEGAILLTSEMIEVAKDGVSSLKLYNIKDKSPQYTRGQAFIAELTVLEFYDFLYTLELDHHFGDIVNHWVKLRKNKR